MDNAEPIKEAEVVESQTPEKPESKAYTPEEFRLRYQSLCDETGYQIVITPVWVKRDDNSYSMIVQTSVGQMPKE